MLPFGGSFLLYSEFTILVVQICSRFLLSTILFLFFFLSSRNSYLELSIGKFLTKNPLRSLSVFSS
jgi:hypothetical protein